MGLDDYEGMPPFREVGPIVLDESIQAKAEKILEDKKGVFALKIDKMELKQPLKNIEFPADCIIELDLNEIIVFVLDEQKNRTKISCTELTESYPTCVFIKKSNNIFNIHFNADEHIRFSTSNNIQRDVIIMAIRMFCGRKLYHELNLQAIALMENVGF